MDDLISRRAAIETVGVNTWAGMRLAKLPAAQERKKGKWIEELGMLMCSECGDAWGTQQFDEVMSFNYCPNCGAEMEGEKDERAMG